MILHYGLRDAQRVRATGLRRRLPFQSFRDMVSHLKVEEQMRYRLRRGVPIGRSVACSRSSPIELVMSRLKQVAASGDGWSARCPAHADDSPSLSVGIGADGQVLLYCHAGCSFDEIVEALELEPYMTFSKPRKKVKKPLQRVIKGRQNDV